MNKDEMFLRHHLRQWLYRHLEGSGPEIQVMIRIKTEYWMKYGWDELKRIIREVTMEVAYEQMPEVQNRSRGVSNDVPELWSAVANTKRLRKPRWTEAQHEERRRQCAGVESARP